MEEPIHSVNKWAIRGREKESTKRAKKAKFDVKRETFLFSFPVDRTFRMIVIAVSSRKKGGGVSFCRMSFSSIFILPSLINMEECEF